MYINKKQTKKNKGRVEDEEVILIKPYKVSKSTSTKSSSFIDEEVNNLLRYIKFIKSPTQTRIFQPPPYYQVLQSKGEQNPNLWNKTAIVIMENKHNIETLRNRYPINMF